METQTNSTNKEKTRKFTKHPPVELTRTFKSPVEIVWAAWSQPELIKQWWGPVEFSCPEAKVDFKVGGQALLAMKDPDGKVIWSTGTYKEIVLHKKIVVTDSFSDELGNIIPAKQVGMPGDWDEPCLITISFHSPDPGSTVMNIYHEGIPSEVHDDCVSGWSSSLDKMRTLVEKNYPI
jgi:uncharacterized protein YndB with AHSA1/START domain